MGRTFKSRYGLPPDTVKNLADRWYKKVRLDSTWKTFDDFCKWAAENDYVSFSKLKKYDETKPHGPDNSFWYLQDRNAERARNREKAQAAREIVSPFCEGCKMDSYVCQSVGCYAWREAFVKKLERENSQTDEACRTGTASGRDTLLPL